MYSLGTKHTNSKSQERRVSNGTTFACSTGGFGEDQEDSSGENHCNRGKKTQVLSVVRLVAHRFADPRYTA